MKSLKSIIKYQRLPAEYQEVEYIESNGTQYIDTGFNPNLNTNIEIQYSVTSTTNNVIAGVQSSNSARISFWAANSPSPLALAWHYGATDTGAVSTQQLNKIYIVKNDKNKLYLDGELVYTSPSRDFQTLNSLYIFARHNQNTVDRQSKARIYYAKIWDNNSLIRNFIPCYRKADNVIGMYDLVNGEFYTNQGTGTFLKGNDVKNYIESIKTNLLKYQRLPSAYQEVEYIESTGTQYIDTGVSPDNSTGLKVVFSNLIAETNDFNFIGCRLQGSSRFMINYTNGNFGYGWDDYYTTNEKINVSVKNTAELNYYNNRHFIANGNTLVNLSTISISNMPTIYIFGQHVSGSSSNFKAYKVYECEITQDDLLIRKFIPCYRKSDNELGLYDTISGTFFTNQGTGTFLKGNDVRPYIESIEKIIKTSKLPDTYQEVEYLESSGTQYINTGFYPSNNDIRLKFDALFYNTNDQRFCGINNLVVAMSGTYASTFAIRKGAAWFEGNWAGTISTNIKTSFDVSVTSTQTVVKKNNETMATYSTTDSLSGDNSFLVFVSRYSPRNYLYGKLYSFQIYESETLVRDLIPCYRKADNVIGMYDLANDVFYTNAGTGTFLKGKNIY